MTQDAPQPRPSGWYIHESLDGKVSFLPLARAHAKRRREGGYVYHATQGWALMERDEQGGWTSATCLGSTKVQCRERKDICAPVFDRYQIEMTKKRRRWVEDFVRFAHYEEGLRCP